MFPLGIMGGNNMEEFGEEVCGFSKIRVILRKFHFSDCAATWWPFSLWHPPKLEDPSSAFLSPFPLNPNAYLILSFPSDSLARSVKSTEFSALLYFMIVFFPSVFLQVICYCYMNVGIRVSTKLLRKQWII